MTWLIDTNQTRTDVVCANVLLCVLERSPLILAYTFKYDGWNGRAGMIISRHRLWLSEAGMDGYCFGHEAGHQVI